MDIIIYEDEICCDDVESFYEYELIDTYGGNYSYRSTHICRKCKRVFYEYSGRFQGISEETNLSELKQFFGD